MVKVRSVLVEYIIDLQSDYDTPYPEELGAMGQTSIDFEVSKLFEHILKTTTCRRPYIMDVPHSEVQMLVNNPDDNIRISALLSIIAARLPQLELRSRV